MAKLRVLDAAFRIQKKRMKGTGALRKRNSNPLFGFLVVLHTTPDGFRSSHNTTLSNSLWQCVVGISTISKGAQIFQKLFWFAHAVMRPPHEMFSLQILFLIVHINVMCCRRMSASWRATNSCNRRWTSCVRRWLASSPCSVRIAMPARACRTWRVRCTHWHPSWNLKKTRARLWLRQCWEVLHPRAPRLPAPVFSGYQLSKITRPRIEVWQECRFRAVQTHYSLAFRIMHWRVTVPRSSPLLPAHAALVSAVWRVATSSSPSWTASADPSRSSRWMAATRSLHLFPSSVSPFRQPRSAPAPASPTLIKTASTTAFTPDALLQYTVYDQSHNHRNPSPPALWRTMETGLWMSSKNWSVCRMHLGRASSSPGFRTKLPLRKA